MHHQRTLALTCLSMMMCGAMAGGLDRATPDPPAAAPAALGQPAGSLDSPELRAALHGAGLPDDPAAVWTPDRIAVLALYFDPELRTAHWTAAMALADAEIAAERTNPTFTLSPERVISAVGDANPWTIVASLAIPWLRHAEYAPRKEAARLDAEVARLEMGATFWQSRSRSLAALRKVLLAREILTRAQQSEAAQAAWVAGVRRRLELGDADRSELLLAESAAVTARAETSMRSGQRLTAENELASALGIAPGILADMRFDWPDLHAPPAPAQVSDSHPDAAALNNRLELRQLSLQVQAAEARWREARAGRTPKATGVSPSGTYDRGDTKVGLGIDVELPVFHGQDATIRRADAARQQAKAKLEQRQVQVVAEANRGATEYNARYLEWRSFEDAAAAARHSEAQAQRALQVGEGDRPTLLQIIARRAALEVQALDALQRTVDALGTLEDATEQPIWPSSVLGDVRSPSFVTENPSAH